MERPDDPAAETLSTRFAAQGLRRCRRGGLVFCGFAILLLLLSGIYSGFTEPGIFLELLRIRLLGLLGAGAVLCGLWAPIGARRPRELVLALMAVMILTMHELALPTGGQASPQYDRMGAVILATAVLMSWSAAWSLAGCGVVVGLYLLGSATGGGFGTPAFMSNLGYMLVASAVTVGANAVRERLRWRELEHAQALREAHQRADAEVRRLNEVLEQRVQERTAALRASEQRVRTMVAAAPIGVIAVAADGRVSEANRAFAAMLQRRLEALPGCTIEELTAPDDRARTARAHADLCAGAADVFRMQKHYLRADGSPVATHEAVAAVRDDSGRFLYALAMVEDISERLRAEAQALEHQEHLAHVLRVTTMGGMVVELAHELNQPLGAIVNFANGTGVRLRQSGAAPDLVDSVTQIAAEGMRAAEILRRVRDFVRPGGTPSGVVDVNHLVRDAVVLVDADARRHRIPVQLDLTPSLPAMHLDRIRIEQVILNLLSNAIESMSLHPEREHELVVRTLGQADGAITIEVRDSGAGVSPAEAERVFEAFFTTKPGGLGMGLSISRSIVEAYGGRLWARPNPERGMTFAFSLPAANAFAAAEGDAEHAHDA